MNDNPACPGQSRETPVIDPPIVPLQEQIDGIANTLYLLTERIDEHLRYHSVDAGRPSTDVRDINSRIDHLQAAVDKIANRTNELEPHN